MQTSPARRILNVGISFCLIILIVVVGLGVVVYRHIHAYDKIIVRVGAAHQVETSLIRAVIWKESRFNARQVGKHGEIGLMQLTEGAAREWAAAVGQKKFVMRDLYNPEININAGTWYLKRAIKFWTAKKNPLPYALAEYNAGRSNTLRWAAQDKNDPNIFWSSITYPTTRKYVRDVLRLHERKDAIARLL